jgi:hypothetical protein
VVSPEVKACLTGQAETMLRFFLTEFGPEQGRAYAQRLATELRAVWT